MLNRLLSQLLNFSGVALLYFAASMFFAQTLLAAYFVFAWNIDLSKINQMIAVAQGYDLYQMELEREREFFDQLQQARYDEVLQIRANRLATEDLDRTRADLLKDPILGQVRELEALKKQIEELRRNIEKRLVDVEEERKSNGFTELVTNLSILTPANARRQILKMLDDKQEDRVVEIFNAMEEGPRKKLLNIMKQEEDIDKLADILRRIGDGEPESRIAREAQEELSKIR